MESEKSSTPLITPEEAKDSKVVTPIKKFAFGMGWGLFLVAIYWSYSLFYHSSVPLATGIIASLVFAITCGLITMKVGYEALDNIINSLPF
ncbi:MAG: hypothetical protein WA865_05735 [Spirulinaceae cyanobacterium]